VEKHDILAATEGIIAVCASASTIPGRRDFAFGEIHAFHTHVKSKRNASKTNAIKEHFLISWLNASKLLALGGLFNRSKGLALLC